MKQFYFSFIILFLCANEINAQGPISSKKCFGGSKIDGGTKILPTADGGYILLAYTESTDGDVTGWHGTGYYDDIWVVKVSSANTIEWNKCLGGTNGEDGYDIIELREGGYLVVGSTQSTDGDLAQHNGTGHGWMIKLDDNGGIRWQKNFGGNNYEFIYGVLQNKQGHYIFCGTTRSTDISGYHGGSSDAWTGEIDTSGNMIWQHVYGGAGDDELHSRPAEDADGNYYFAGYTDSTSGDVQGNHGGEDIWVIKTNASGTLLNQKCYGGSSDEASISFVRLANSNLVLAGYTSSTDGQVTNSLGSDDGWIVGIDPSFNLLWQTSVGGNEEDVLTAISELNGQIVTVGYFESADGALDGLNHGKSDMYIATLNSSGTVLKQNCYGGSENDEAWDVAVTNNGDVYICGITFSNNGNMSGNHGIGDAWVGKTSLDITGIEESNDVLQSLSIYPNPTTGSFQIQFTSTEMFTGTLQLINMLGQTISEKSITVLNGTNTMASPTGTGELPKGIYTVHISNPTGYAVNAKIIVK